jgi:uncharacterized protein
MSVDPFHLGERAVQRRVGVITNGGGIRDFVHAQHQEFFSHLPFAVLATSTVQAPTIKLLTGPPGFVTVPHPRAIHLASALDFNDSSLAVGTAAGMLGIDFATRRRNRANGHIAALDAGGLTLAVTQSFGNCPQYIHRCSVSAVARTPGPVVPLSSLDNRARQHIAKAGTFFVASGAASMGIDVSHRGGPVGFVHCEGDVLTVPDYGGNHYFNTLGNLLLHPQAALLFLDFETGDLLHINGAVDIVWNGPMVHGWPGAQRVWQLHVQGAWHQRSAVPLQWTPLVENHAPPQSP